MAARQKTRFAILGLLAGKAMSGYDIKKIVDVGLSHFWNENYGQIYPSLNELVKDGLATKKQEPKRGKRQRFVYTITSKGKKAFRQWIAESTEAPIVRNEFQLKFFLSSNLPTKHRIGLVEAYRSQQQALLDEYQASERLLLEAIAGEDVADELNELLELSGSTPAQRQRQLNTFYLTLRNGVRVVEARVIWCEEAIACLNQEAAPSRH